MTSSIDYFQLVVKIQNVQYGKRLYEELDLELRKWVKNGTITPRVTSVAIKFRTETLRDFYANLLHRKKVALSGKEVDLMVVETQKIHGPEQTADKCKAASEGGSHDDHAKPAYKGYPEGEAEGHIDNSHQKCYEGTIEAEQVEVLEGVIEEVPEDPQPDLEVSLRAPEDKSTTPQDRSWKPIEEFGNINKSNVPDAFARMAMFWFELIVQRNGLSKNAIDLVFYERNGCLSLKAECRGPKHHLGSFQLLDKQAQSPKVQFVVPEEPVTDSVPLHRSPDHTLELQSVCASLLRAGLSVSLHTCTETQEFDINEGILGFYETIKSARKCRNNFLLTPSTKCNTCCSTSIRLGRRPSNGRSLVKMARISKDAWLRAFIEVARSEEINIINKDFALPKRLMETPEKSEDSLVWPRSRLTIHKGLAPKKRTRLAVTVPYIALVTLVPEGPTALMRPKIPTIANTLSSYTQVSSEPQESRQLIRPESQGSLAQELIDRILDKSQKLIEAEGKLREALSIIEKDKATLLQQQQDLAAASTQLRQKEAIFRNAENTISQQRENLAYVSDQLQKEKKISQENKTKISLQRQNLNNVRTQLGKELQEAKDTALQRQENLSGFLHRLNEQREISRIADNTISEQAQNITTLEKLLEKAEETSSEQQKKTAGIENTTKKAEDTISAQQQKIFALEDALLTQQQQTSQAKKTSEALKTANKLVNARTTELHNQNVTVNTSLRDLQADYEIQTRNMQQVEDELERAYQNLRSAGLMSDQKLKREHEGEGENEDSVKRIKLEQMDR